MLGRGGAATIRSVDHNGKDAPMRLALPLAAALAALALVPAGASAAPKPGFAPGTWSGSGSTNGTFVLGGNASPVTGNVSFKLTVAKNLAASGSMTLRSTMTTSVGDLDGKMSGVGTLKLSGTGSKVHYAGTLQMKGSLTDGVMTVPFGQAMPLSGDLVITRAGCAKVLGRTNQRFPLKWTATRKGGSAC
jgi:hypothetical protein